MKTTVTLLILLTLFSLNIATLIFEVTVDYPDGAQALPRSKRRISGNIAYSPNGTRLAVAGVVGIWLYDLATRQEVSLITGHTDRVASVAFSPDGNTIASGSYDSTVRLWNVSKNNQSYLRSGLLIWHRATGINTRTLTGHTNGVNSVAFSPDGNTIASGSYDDTVRLWDVNTGEHKRTLTGHTDGVLSVAFSPDGNTIASHGNWGPTVKLWDVATGINTRTLTAHTGWVNSVAFSPDGNTIAGGDSHEVRLWNVNTGEHKRTFTGHKNLVRSVAFSPDGNTLASASDGGRVRLWDVNTGEHKRTLTAHKDSVGSVAFSPDGNTLVSGSGWLEDRRHAAVLLWELPLSTFTQIHPPAIRERPPPNPVDTKPKAEEPPPMVPIPAGELQMGSNDPEANYDEQPVHTVYIDAFYMDKYEVTNAQYKKFIDAKPEWQKDHIDKAFHNGNYLEDWNGNDYPSGYANHPVRFVSWYAAMAYAQWAEKRLPTQAEWEYAARGGLVGKKYPWGDTMDIDKANYRDAVDGTTPVGTYPPNGYGLYDMVGNVWEWCLDEFNKDFYSVSPRENPLSGANSVDWIMSNFTGVKTRRVLRGGSFLHRPASLHIVECLAPYPDSVNNFYGFRCARDQ